jgi:neutral trehalase
VGSGSCARPAQLEEWLGEAEMSARWRRLADETEARLQSTFWNEARGLFSDDPAQEHYSEHTQCLALLQHELGGNLEQTRRERMAHGLLHDTDLARTTIYFTHYLFETFVYGTHGCVLRAHAAVVRS